MSRYYEKECYKVDAAWLNQFMSDLEKNAHNIDYLKHYVSKNNNLNKFKTISEKLDDIKARVGFDMALKVISELEGSQSIKESSDLKNCKCNNYKCNDSCKCDGACKCNVKSASIDAKSVMSNILSYIKDVVKHEPHMSVVSIISKCKEDPSLRYNDIESKIDHKKLCSYIEKLVGHSKEYPAEYISLQNDHSLEDTTADYYRHAYPTHN